MTDQNSRLIAGAMSGTSADGVDVAITRITGRGLGMSAELVLHHHRPYDTGLRQAIFALRNSGHTELRELARIGREVSLTYAAAVTEALNAANMKACDLAAIAAHGQTLFHEVPLTIQYFDPSLVAYEVGCPVVSDFRRADIAAGGQGAPLVPFADYILFRSPTRNRVLLNIGGISNITILSAGATPDRVIAFDTGPGNCICDWLMRKHDPAGPGFDAGGAVASRGKVLNPVVQTLFDEEYFDRPAPKSTDGPQMIACFERALHRARHEIPANPAFEDLMATAASITFDCTYDAIGSNVGWAAEGYDLIASGGGVHNAAIMGWFHEMLPESSNVLTTQDFGVPADAKEALAFALLGAATLDGVPSNVPSVTGARRGVVLGSITPKP